MLLGPLLSYALVAAYSINLKLNRVKADLHGKTLAISGKQGLVLSLLFPHQSVFLI